MLIKVHFSANAFGRYIRHPPLFEKTGVWSFDLRFYSASSESG